jgi:hypothetical protein
MPVFGPVSRTELVCALRQAGFSGPYAGSKHQFMERANVRLRLPNPHRGDIGMGLLSRLLAQAGISREEWERL